MTAAADYQGLREHLESRRTKTTFKYFLRHAARALAELVGRGWEEGVLSVADEHAFSRRFQAYLGALAKPGADAAHSKKERPMRLVVVFPGDEHELGAFMQYVLLSHYDIPARFCGTLPAGWKISLPQHLDCWKLKPGPLITS